MSAGFWSFSLRLEMLQYAVDYSRCGKLEEVFYWDLFDRKILVFRHQEQAAPVC